jgi:molybdenum cofactor biosynthesis protein B
MNYTEHRAKAPKRLGIGIIVVSDSRAAAAKRGRDLDESGKIIEKETAGKGHTARRLIVPYEEGKIRSAFENFLNDGEIDSIIITGGTGIARKDVTIETIEPFFEKSLPGFGEALRRKGYEMVGTPALLTRASAGVVAGKPVFCLPGAPNAVRTAMKLILPDLPHVVRHARE